jgi:hypothetical protein
MLASPMLNTGDALRLSGGRCAGQKHSFRLRLTGLLQWYYHPSRAEPRPALETEAKS